MSKVNVYQIITDRLIALLEQGTAPWRKPWANMGLPRNAVSGKRYQGVNVYMLMGAPYESPYWLTYKQALELGGHVRKGEKGMPVVYAHGYKLQSENAENEVSEMEIVDTRFFLRYYTVFNVCQCEGVKLPYTAGGKVNNLIEIAEMIVEDMPNKPRIKHGGDIAGYSGKLDTVFMPAMGQFDGSGEYYSTLFHELAHSTGHESRLNREGIANFSRLSNSYAKEELIAEMAAAYLGAYCGIVDRTIDNSAAYLQNWIDALKGDNRLAIQAAREAQKAANYILNKTEA